MTASRRTLIERRAPAMAWAGLIVLGDGNHRPALGVAPHEPSNLPLFGGLSVLLALLVWTTQRFRRASPHA